MIQRKQQASLHGTVPQIDTEVDGSDVDSCASDDRASREKVLYVENSRLKRKLESLTQLYHETCEALDKSRFRFESLKACAVDVEFYTGLPDEQTLLVFFDELLKTDAQRMRQWRGKESKDIHPDHKVGRKCKPPLLEQLFLVLVRLRVGLPVHDLAKRFDLSKSTVSRLTVTWVNLCTCA